MSKRSAGFARIDPIRPNDRALRWYWPRWYWPLVLAALVLAALVLAGGIDRRIAIISRAQANYEKVMASTKGKAKHDAFDQAAGQ